jgi:uncharacterized repeat protein (TIGR03803 family)
MKKLSLCFLNFVLAASAFAQTYQQVYVVPGNRPFVNPYAGLAIVGKVAYSSTQYGGVYSATPGALADHRSQCSTNQACFSYASLTPNGLGQLFGVTPLPLNSQGLAAGEVFMVDTTKSGWPATALYQFTGGADGGIGPGATEANLIFDAAGNLWGTTYTGGNFGCPYGNQTVYCGVVFELVNNGNGTWTEQVIHAFSGPDGWGPVAALTLYQGNFYGTTEFGGDLNCSYDPGEGCGTLFELTPNQKGGWTETILHNFEGGVSDGAQPLAGVTIDAQGDIFGTTGYAANLGNDPGGSVYELSAGGVYSLLQSDMGVPEGALVFDKQGNLWGTSSQGGLGFGTVFELVKGVTFQVLHNFTGGDVPPDGAFPAGALAIDGNGNLWGTTPKGGYKCGCGTFFEVKP